MASELATKTPAYQNASRSPNRPEGGVPVGVGSSATVVPKITGGQEIRRNWLFSAFEQEGRRSGAIRVLQINS